MSNTRICVKQIPKHLTEKRFKDHFEKFGIVTDAKILKTKDGKSRLFGFIGFSSEESAQKALSLNNTYIDTSKIIVQLATSASETNVETNRPWSKYSQGSSSFKRIEDDKVKKESRKKEKELLKLKKQQDKQKKQNPLLDQDLENDEEYQKFKKLMTPRVNKKLWENDDEIGVGGKKKDNDSDDDDSGSDEEGGSKKKRKVDEKLAFEGDDSDDELYEEMPAVQVKTAEEEEQEALELLKKKDKLVNDSAVSDLDWLKSKVKDVQDTDMIDNQDEEDEDEDEEDEEEDEEEEKPTKKNKSSSKQDKQEEQEEEQEEEEEEEKEEKEEEQDKKKEIVHKEKEEIEDVGDSGRIFIRNLPYTAKEEDLEQLFSKYGKISEIHVPIDVASKRTKGIAFILYLIPENAVQAMNEMDGKAFQGRIIHILPAHSAPNKIPLQQEGDQEGSSSFKSEKEKKLKSESGSNHNWNTLFMRSDAIVSSLAERYKMTQGELLDPNAVDIAVRMTLMETHIINETKKFLQEEGVIIENIGDKVSQRSNTVILVKNIPFRTEEAELETLFGKFGSLSRVVLAPARTIALVEYVHPTEAKIGFKNLAYSKFHFVPLYLEWAPLSIFKSGPKPKQTKEEKDTKSSTSPSTSSTKEDQEKKSNTSNTTTPPSSSANSHFVYIKNLSWKTSNENLVTRFKNLKDFVNATIATKADPKNPGKRLPVGYGFAEFSSKQGAYECIKKLNGSTIDGHEINLKLSDKNEVNKTADSSAGNKRTREDSKSTNGTATKSPVSTKIIIKNLPFESTAKEIRKLFSTYGEIQSVRLPKKPNGGHRGFAFVEFLTEQESKNAMEALTNSHFYGRHLVLQYAEQDKNIDELREKANTDYDKIKSSKY
ncbi:hypothetical protein CYY_002649 [Polysphondylium violaceum]|uniref:RRM domain-containing protein n=1 Tax=Polysphondylium violaceum TaxID=133409 RepID=A0A8J4V0P2_9MYCE|nr:hypothetical protein CYY_002649 [Polysphondylium violaceum]